jgi:hypothetical protein
VIGAVAAEATMPSHPNMQPAPAIQKLREKANTIRTTLLEERLRIVNPSLPAPRAICPPDNKRLKAAIEVRSATHGSAASLCVERTAPQRGHQSPPVVTIIAAQLNDQQEHNNGARSQLQ